MTTNDGISSFGDPSEGRDRSEASGRGSVLTSEAATAEHVSATVPIQAPPMGDGEAVDIRLDEEERETQPSTQADNRSYSKQRGATFSEDTSLSLWMTPARCVKTVVPGAKGWQVNFVEQQKQENTHTATYPLASKSDSTENGKIASPFTTSQALPSSPPAGQSSAQGLTEELGQQAVTSLPPLTEKDLFDSLPHPNAIFHPDVMQWQVVLLRSELEDRYEVKSPTLPFDNTDSTTPLWRFQSTEEYHPKDDRAIISLPQLRADVSAPAWQPIYAFDQYRSTIGPSVFTTAAGHLRSVVPRQLLESFKKERLSNPRPGMTGHLQFFESASTLIRIVGNAANGEVRALSAAGKTMSVKLGLDQHTDDIFTSLGFQRDESTGTVLLKPPDMASGLWQLRLRRAFVELALWLHYEKQEDSEQANEGVVGQNVVSFALQAQPCQPFLEHLFRFDPTTQESAPLNVSTSPALALKLASIGADEGSTDELLNYCYEMNSKQRSILDRTSLLSALVDVVEEQRRDSEPLQTTIAMEKSKGFFTIKDLTQAYKKILDAELNSFEAMAQVDENFLVDVYRNSAKSVASEVAKLQELKDSLTIISQSRECPSTLEEALKQPIELDIDKAYEILEVQHDTDEDFISSAFQLASIESRFSAAQCLEALRVIGEHRNSSALKKLYRKTTGEEEEDDPWAAGEATRPAGLNNIGNTCYLNSVLQYFYAIRPLREGVLKAEKEGGKTKSNDGQYAIELKVGGRKLTGREIERSHRFVELLGQLFEAMKTSPASAVSPERDLAYLALVSSRVEEEQEKAMQKDNVDRAENSDSVGQEVASGHSTATEATLVDESLPVSSIDAQATRPVDAASGQNSKDLHTTDMGPILPPRRAPMSGETAAIGQRRNSLMQLGAQQDVSECLDNVMFQVEAALSPPQRKEFKEFDADMTSAKRDAMSSAEGNLLRTLFLGCTNQRLEAEVDEKSRRSPKQEVFKILPVDVVEEGRDIYEGLDGFFAEEMLTDSSGQPIRRTVALVDAPPIMQIQLQRVQYDRVRGVYKSQAHLALGETLFMDRYMDFDPTKLDDQARIEKRRKSREIRLQISALRSRIHDLRRSKDENPVSRSLDKTASFLASLQKGRSLLHPLSDEGESDSALGGGMPSELLDEEFNAFLQGESKLVDDEVRENEEKIEALKALSESLWSDERRFEYVLASVFMHRGEATHGHYFLNQRTLAPAANVIDGSNPPSSTWFKYNDNVVQEISLDQVLKDTTGATPYLLSYVRKDEQESKGLFETVCREIDAGIPNPNVSDKDKSVHQEGQERQDKSQQGARDAEEDVDMSDWQQTAQPVDGSAMDTSL